MRGCWKLLVLVFFCLNGHSCSTSSNVPGELYSEVSADSFAYLSSESIVHASTLSNLVSTFPKFQNQAVNQEVSLLKLSLTEYINSVKTYNQNKKQEKLHLIENQYKKIQKLRKFMIKDDDDILNRYLVKIKTTINLLESSQNKTTENSSSIN